MANQEHVDILKQGVEVWNKWRKEHLSEQLDLSDTDFSYALLGGVNLSGVNLSGADLSGATLRFADLSHTNLYHTSLRLANLNGANLIDANLRLANLNDANLNGASLRLANLNGANLNGASLLQTNLTHADLSGTDLSRAWIGWTILGDHNLRVIKGLETIFHEGPSLLSINTIYLSEGDIPEVFIRGTGAPDVFIESMRSLVSKPIEFYSCFISYSSKDQKFAERLYADLQANNVRCWYAPEDLKIGDKVWDCIDKSIRLYDKLLVVISANSVASDWVENEVMAALEKERQELGKTVLFPIKLDNAVMETNLPWAANIRRMRHIGDFTRWKEHDEYQQTFQRLLRDLKAQS